MRITVIIDDDESGGWEPVPAAIGERMAIEVGHYRRYRNMRLVARTTDGFASTYVFSDED